MFSYDDFAKFFFKKLVFYRCIFTMLGIVPVLLALSSCTILISPCDTLAEIFIILVRSLQRGGGDFSDPTILYIFDQHSWKIRSSHISLFISPSVCVFSVQTSL